MSLTQELDFTDRTAIITGVSGGIGTATALAFTNKVPTLS